MEQPFVHPTFVRYTAKTSITKAVAHPGWCARQLLKVRGARYRSDLDAWQKNVGRAAGKLRRQPRGESDDFRSAAERFGSAHREHVEPRLAGPLPCCNFIAAAGTHVQAVGV
ncbi:hypothetical protein [Streptomyces sp. MMS24-I29]|uniref:hypothetical protein n=1 Tax=Streptomyces sp. MMS24-I29 TaxID=3351480 RepID=UPI003C7EB7EF